MKAVSGKYVQWSLTIGISLVVATVILSLPGDNGSFFGEQRFPEIRAHSPGKVQSSSYDYSYQNVMIQWEYHRMFDEYRVEVSPDQDFEPAFATFKGKHPPCYVPYEILGSGGRFYYRIQVRELGGDWSSYSRIRWFDWQRSTMNSDLPTLYTTRNDIQAEVKVPDDFKVDAPELIAFKSFDTPLEEDDRMLSEASLFGIGDPEPDEPGAGVIVSDSSRSEAVVSNRYPGLTQLLRAVVMACIEVFNSSSLTLSQACYEFLDLTFNLMDLNSPLEIVGFVIHPVTDQSEDPDFTVDIENNEAIENSDDSSGLITINDQGGVHEEDTLDDVHACGTGNDNGSLSDRTRDQ